MTNEQHGTAPADMKDLADRPATDEERQAAERGRAGVDLEDVTAHEQEMTKLGANVRGEGQIEPRS